MTFVRSFVTIGAHHRGPHVDALYALAERCGAEVVRLPEEPVRWPRQFEKVPYAGQDFPEGERLKAMWEQP
ncbi:MAG TPA: hypothetical protein VN036_00590 [Devosia sp.]|nr:hypothetical protein [Devosia sp.]